MLHWCECGRLALMADRVRVNWCCAACRRGDGHTALCDQRQAARLAEAGLEL
jgi:hypothetical protein